MQLQWVGRAAALVDVARRRILTDPLLTRRVAHLRRRRPLLIRPGMVVPIHWGTYAPEDGRRVPSWFDDPPEQFEQALADAGLSRYLHLLHPGESVSVT